MENAPCGGQRAVGSRFVAAGVRRIAAAAVYVEIMLLKHFSKQLMCDNKESGDGP
jgi:hypothetical protein